MDYKFKPDYKHVRRDICGGVIGIYDRTCYTCDKYGKEFKLYEIEYDRLMMNSLTGWIFPVINLENSLN